MKNESKLYTLYGVFMVFILWEALHLVVHSAAVPAPVETLKNCIQLLKGTEIYMHLAYSFVRLIVAIGLSLIIGVSLGTLMGLCTPVDRFVAPILYVLFPIPKVALLPILFIFFGLGEVSKIGLILLILVFQMTLMVRDAIHAIPSNILLSAKIMHLQGWAFYKHLILPCISKTVISGTRISAGTGIAVLFFAENYATTQGLGFFIMNSWSLIDYVNLYSGIVFLSGMGGFIFTFLDYLEKKYCHWQYS